MPTETREDHQGIAPALVEKEYWIMQGLYGLQQLGLRFELKGGTSLSKGYGLISRFSEDIDIRIEPPADPVESSPPSAWVQLNTFRADDDTPVRRSWRAGRRSPGPRGRRDCHKG